MRAQVLLFRPFVILFLLLWASGASGQEKKEKEKKTGLVSNKIFNFQFHYTYELPGGDLTSRFGPIHNIGFGGLLKTKKNWIFSLDASYQFGSDVKENILYNLTNSTLVISNSSGFPGLVSLGQRGFNAFAKAGKLFVLTQKNVNSGIVILAGVGFLSHKININTPQNNLPPLTDELKKGYDRLSMGFALSEFIGYQFQSKNRFINFFAGVDVIQAFTKNVRGYNYDQKAFDNGRRFDVFLGPRIGWMIPVYLTTKDEDEFYFR